MPRTQTTPTLTSIDVTPAEREIINLLRANAVTEAELVTVPRGYLNLLRASYEAIKGCISKAQYAVDVMECVVSQSVTKE